MAKATPKIQIFRSKTLQKYIQNRDKRVLPLALLPLFFYRPAIVPIYDLDFLFSYRLVRLVLNCSVLLTALVKIFLALARHISNMDLRLLIPL
jgi:hypothetical protein